MEAIQNILITVLLGVWSCVSVGFLVSMIQSIINDRRREKREQAQAARDLEYHEKRMKDYR